MYCYYFSHVDMHGKRKYVVGNVKTLYPVSSLLYSKAEARKECDRLNDRIFARAYQQTYHSIAGDCWGEKTPKLGEFRDVLRDSVDIHGGLTRDELAELHRLPTARQNRLMGRP